MLKNLASLNNAELKEFLESFDNVMCDCDGVIWKLNDPISGVKETLAELKKRGKQVRFVSNNCTLRPEAFQKKLNNFHFEAEIDDVVIPTLAVTAYLKKIKFQKEIFVSSFPAMRQELLKAGFKVAHAGPDKVDERLEELPLHLQDNEEIGAIVINLDLNLNYVRLLKLLVYLKRPDVLFITTGTDKKLPFGFNILLIGPGYFTKILEDLSGRTALEFGKPSENLNNFIVEKFNITDPSRTLFIGDALEQDMGFATAHGYQKLLVLTGVTDLDQASSAEKEIMADYYLPSLGDLHELIKDIS